MRRARSGSPRSMASVSAVWVFSTALRFGRRRIVARRGAAFGPPLLVAAPQRLEAADHRDHRRVAAPANESVVKLTAEIGENGPVVADWSDIDALSPCSSGTMVVTRSARCAASAAHVGSRSRSAVPRSSRSTCSLCRTQPEHVGGAGLGRGVHHRSALVAAPHGYQTLGLEYPQRLAQRHQADVEPLDEDGLRREQIAVGQLAVHDLAAQFVGDGLGDTRRCQVVVGSPGLHRVVVMGSPVRERCLSRLRQRSTSRTLQIMPQSVFFTMLAS